MVSSIKKVIVSTDNKTQYDAQCKKILSKRIFLARILKHVTEEFKDLEETEIIKSIDNISVSTTSTDPGMGIIGRKTEDSELNEGTVYYDIIFDAVVDNKEKDIQLIINVEAQKSMDTGYSLLTRGIYYTARMISSQKETIFQNNDYDKIRKVYSIWICMNPRQYNSGSITEFHLTPQNLVSAGKYRKSEYDKIAVVMINLGKSDNELLGMLSVLLSDELSSSEKIKLLQTDYAVKMDDEAIKEVNIMCNLSDLIEEKGIEQGIEKGIEREKRFTIKNMLEHNFTDDQILLVTGVSIEKLINIKKELKLL